MKQVTINYRWPLWMPEHRENRPGWNWWEWMALAALWDVVRPGDVLWDVGAEYGDLSALYATWGAEVVLIEAMPKAWPWIRQIWQANVARPPRGTACCLVGDAEDDRPLNLCAGWPPISYEEEIEEPGFMAWEDGNSPRRNLDTLLDAFSAPAIVVMDIEGSELRALFGAHRLLLEVRPIWKISVHPEMMRGKYGDTPDDLLVLMTDHYNYESHYIHYDHEQHWLFKPRPM
jgi:FkbM family methyltransferase